MPRVQILPHPTLCPDGRAFDAKRGASLCESLLANGIELEHACEMVAACATCHVHVRAGGTSLTPPDDEENDQLDNAWGLDAHSRLACCVKLRDDDLTIDIPLHTRNLARER
ncbi:2Fe-2S iron-sulfur cluster-binding protein [Trinickia caryophylli]|uniref:Ferredoxin, 2Fe-2S n=1 Tax=Trinickia caryophylli TaxID=28094 RepID=A0A1X7EFK5_TRICW|nr:2Fe-2S iron-sulfur cluster-binding protein [Trinickia caryophylli]PMS11105.1 2Fe-2S ferredoxin [Trinickia caryophylli]TRX14560.1 2Fe-2S iron-sulfur cluster binding domain-containing protein [Trinickia caryophylli]WQE14399.1 2Fe-2S iron-sulfur cluster-binding protein [Trinickia caryophylli]SMF33064.1 ferredoxin, 2Fe-2S [Trinickia caryophylli]GLU32203.1 ferredoxin, 2Fe-2S type, ISC system [Trinickia caryophylli]